MRFNSPYAIHLLYCFLSASDSDSKWLIQVIYETEERDHFPPSISHPTLNNKHRLDRIQLFIYQNARISPFSLEEQ